MWPQPDIWVLRSLADLRVRGEEGGYTYPLKFFFKSSMQLYVLYQKAI